MMFRGRGGTGKRKKTDDTVTREGLRAKLTGVTFPLTGEVPCVKEALVITNGLLQNPDSLAAFESLIRSFDSETIKTMVNSIRTTTNISTRKKILTQTLFSPLLTPMHAITNELSHVGKIVEETAMCGAQCVATCFLKRCCRVKR
jgi:hypothetical protein